VAGLTLTIACMAVVSVLASPQVLAPLTARSTAELAFTTDFRTRAWGDAIDVWSASPVIGYGPGQSSIRLATWAPSAMPGAPGLASAQGAWAAALIDAGVFGLACWLFVWGGVIVTGARAVLRRPDALRLAVGAASVAAVLEVMIAGDRVYPREWLMMVLPFAFASGKPTADDPDRARQQSEAQSQECPPGRVDPRPAEAVDRD
jgi:O-antigen ligase